MNQVQRRRQLLKYLLGSPILAAGLGHSTLRAVADDAEIVATNLFYRKDLGGLIETVDQAINVFDFEKVAKTRLPPAHYSEIRFTWS